MKKVKDVMIRSVVTVNQTNSLDQVRKAFSTNKMSHLLVTDSVGMYKGVISKTDLLEKITNVMLATSGRRYTELELHNIQAHSIMTGQTVNIRPEDTIEYATEVLLQKTFHCLPVVKNFRAVGILTKHDLLKSYYEEKAFTNAANYE